MQLKKAIKKGFTLVELVVVIAVIAILAATSVGVYFGMLESANRSADQQAVVQMNKILLIEDTLGDVDNILDVHKAFERNGLSTEHYTALAKDHTFYYDTDYNKILYVNNSGSNLVVEYPEEHKDQTWATRSAAGAQWYSLNLSIKETAPTGSNYVRNGENITATVTTANEFAYVMKEAKNIGKTGNIKITLSGTIDMMGADTTIPVLNGNFELIGENNATIKNIASNSYSIKPTDGTNTYGSGIIGYANPLSSVHVKGITFENIHIDGAMSNTGGCGIVVGFNTQAADIDLEDIVIKNSSVSGNRSTGALIGHCYTDYDTGNDLVKTFKNITIENTNVYTNGGRSSLVIGLLNKHFATKADFDKTINEYNPEVDLENIVVDSASKLLPYNNADVLSYDQIKDNGKAIRYFYNSKESSKYIYNEIYKEQYFGFDEAALVTMTAGEDVVYAISSFDVDLL